MLSLDDFMLNKEIKFLNNGSFGACPKIIFDKYQYWQRVLEYQPVNYFQNMLIKELEISRTKLAEFINSDKDDIILVHNATFATNIVIRSLNLAEGDEVITTDHEYGACMNALEFWRREKGFLIKTIEIPLPKPSIDDILALFTEKINERTKVLFMSQISSKTAQIFPVKEICELCKKHGIITIIDAAHSIGHIDIDLKELEADFYFSNIHKWLFAPKGCAFLNTKKEYQSIVKPLITGWGWGNERELGSGSDYVDTNQYYGTNDLSSYMTIPDCIEFYHKENIAKERLSCRALITKLLERTEKIWSFEKIYKSEEDYMHMAIIEVPVKFSQKELKSILYFGFGIEIPVILWKDRMFVRVSVQVYNTWDDLIFLIKSLEKIFK
ncbi:MAG: aminotransferase class V-fold PLP-dependent enzyme [Candidatus Delongbacteria bacterium]|nr:aminotransferase class V-fold PLP-dependent enzyme [Candidatus Delongbacteria bacterium]MBN2835270.1 aminotransferase class V-fold PLP-dependent enzyme [Candidatus Delongbacteria bacterium]